MTGASELTLGNTVDWEFAASVGERLARPAPPSTEYTRRQVIDELTVAAEKAEPPVRDVTGLIADGVVPPARVVDRPAWIRSAAESMRAMTHGSAKPRGFLTGRITGAQTGAVLAFVASGILGQYDPFGAAGEGCLLLVYPNVIAVERQLRVEPSDFRLWVCLHEVTHRVQFTANPWLSGYMSQALNLLTFEPVDDIGRVVSRLADFIRSRGHGTDDSEVNPSGILGLVRAVQSEPQRKALDQLLVLGTLLEGHAEHVMDAVGPMVVPSVATIRRQAQPVHPRQGIRRPCGRPGGNEAVQHDLVGPRDAAVACRDRKPAAMDRQSAVAQLRAAAEQFARVHLDACDRWSVGLSGGPDSLALTAVAARLWPTTALIVDHGLQPGSATVAETARIQAISLGCVDARVLCVQVGAAGGREAAARSARYSALEEHRDGPVLLAHTLDDQAETVLLGLGRGSGARSIAGMRPYDPPWCRPLLGVRRSVTHAACRELGLTAWQDPHNTDRRFTRTRLRTEVLPLLEDVLGGGVAEALARTATALREDTDLIDTIAAQALPGAAVAGSRGQELSTSALTALPDAVRRRVIRGWLLAGGATGLTDRQIRGVDRLVTAWRGQGGVAVGSTLRGQRLVAGRRDGVLVLRREPV